MTLNSLPSCCPLLCRTLRYPVYLDPCSSLQAHHWTCATLLSPTCRALRTVALRPGRVHCVPSPVCLRLRHLLSPYWARQRSTRRLPQTRTLLQASLPICLLPPLAPTLILSLRLRTRPLLCLIHHRRRAAVLRDRAPSFRHCILLNIHLRIFPLAFSV